MSNIPKARAILHGALSSASNYDDLKTAIIRALRLMRRVPYIRKAKAERKIITKAIRFRVKEMSKKHRDMTQMQIAVQNGLRSPGRVSEILHGKR